MQANVVPCLSYYYTLVICLWATLAVQFALVQQPMILYGFISTWSSVHSSKGQSYFCPGIMIPVCPSAWTFLPRDPCTSGFLHCPEFCLSVISSRKPSLIGHLRIQGGDLLMLLTAIVPKAWQSCLSVNICWKEGMFRAALSMSASACLCQLWDIRHKVWETHGWFGESLIKGLMKCRQGTGKLQELVWDPKASNSGIRLPTLGSRTEKERESCREKASSIRS